MKPGGCVGLAKKSKSGGEGTVHGLLDSSGYCTKLYHEVPMPPSGSLAFANSLEQEVSRKGDLS
jgi:hypothetical protein